MAETAERKGEPPAPSSTGHREVHRRWSPEVWAILGVGVTLLVAMFGLGALMFQLVESLRSDMREDMRDVRAQLSQQGEMLAQHGKKLAQHGEKLVRHGEMLAQHGEMLAQHGERLAHYGERLARIEGRLELVLPSGPAPEAQAADEGRG